MVVASSKLMQRAAGWWVAVVIVVAALGAAVPPANAQSTPDAGALPPEYLIGSGDVLTVNFWRRTDVSGDVTVRPDGKISLLLLDDVQASGFTPEQLRD